MKKFINLTSKFVDEVREFSGVIGTLYDKVAGMDENAARGTLEYVLNLARRVAKDNARWFLEYKIAGYDLILQRNKMASLAVAVKENRYAESDYKEDFARFDADIKRFFDAVGKISEAVEEMTEHNEQFMDNKQAVQECMKLVPEERLVDVTFLMAGVASAINLMDNYQEMLDLITEEGQLNMYYRQVNERLDDTKDKSYS